MSDEKCTCGIVPERTQGIVHRGEMVVPSRHVLVAYTPTPPEELVNIKLVLSADTLKELMEVAASCQPDA